MLKSALGRVKISNMALIKIAKNINRDIALPAVSNPAKSAKAVIATTMR
ncbi:hypothetical protein JCM14036_03820 [Desulfotomaculum defluvii]